MNINRTVKGKYKYSLCLFFGNNNMSRMNITDIKIIIYACLCVCAC